MPVPQLPFDVLCNVIKQSDIVDLLRWRRTSFALRRETTRILRKHMKNLIDEYISDGDYFLDALRRHHAVVAAEVALAFFLDDPRVLTAEMEVSIGEPHVHDFIAELQEHYGPIGLFRMRHPSPEQEWQNSPHQRQSVVLSVGSRAMRRRIRILTSCKPNASPSPLLPITGASNTALFCFFNPDIIGCAYPAFTLRRCAVPRGPYYPAAFSTSSELYRHMRLVAHADFRMAPDAAALMVPPLAPVPPQEPIVGWPWAFPPEIWCMGHYGLCACRARFFGDDASLLAILDDTHVSDTMEGYLVHRNVPREPLHGIEGTASVIVAWEFPRRNARCIGLYDFVDHTLGAGESDEAGWHVPVRSVLFNLEPYFVGEHMWGSHPWTCILQPDWTVLPLSTRLRGVPMLTWRFQDTPTWGALRDAIEVFMTRTSADEVHRDVHGNEVSDAAGGSTEEAEPQVLEEAQ